MHYPKKVKRKTTLSLDVDLVAAYDVICGENPRSVLINGILREVAIERGYISKDGAKA